MTKALASTEAQRIYVQSSLTVKLAVNALLNKSGRRLIVFACDETQGFDAMRIFVAVGNVPRHLGGGPVQLLEPNVRLVQHTENETSWLLGSDAQDRKPGLVVALTRDGRLKVDGVPDLGGVKVMGKLVFVKGVPYLR